MDWADRDIEKLKRGEAVQFRPHGHSMEPIVGSGQLVTVEPVAPGKVAVGDVVLCKVNGKSYLHMVKAIQGERFQIGNNKGGINGWTRRVYGKMISVTD